MEPLITIAVAILKLTIHHRAYLLAGQIQHTQRGTILKEGHLLTIRTIFRQKRRHLSVGQLLLLNICSIGEELVFLLHDAALIDLPEAITLCGIHQTAPIRTEVYAALLLWGVCDLLGGVVFHAGHIYITMKHEGHFLAFWAHGYLCGTTTLHLLHHLTVVAVFHYADAHLLWLSTLAHGVDFAIVAKAEHAVLAHAEEAHRMVFQLRQLLQACAVDVLLIDIHCTSGLTEVVEALTIGCPHRVAILALGISEFGEVVVCRFQPHIAHHAGSLMLAPCIFHTLAIVVEDASVWIHAQIVHRHRSKQAHTPTLRTNLIDLRHTLTEVGALCRRQDVALQQHCLIVEEAQRHLIAAMGGQALWHPTLFAYEIDIQTALTPRGKGYLLPIRTPHRLSVIGCISR